MSEQTRRDFVRQAASAGAGLMLAAPAVAQKPFSEDKLNVAVVGVANQGRYNLDNVKGENIVALCDVDETNLAKAKADFPGAATYHDYRKMLERRDIEAVVVCTPDHMHAPITLAALDSGRHVYCEKPLTHTVEEARKVTEMARRKRRVTQMGTQIHAGANYRRVVELVKADAVGPISEVHVWVGTVWAGTDRPAETPPVPSGLHWDLWLGVAPKRPYHPLYTPMKWRGWWDFGGGATADMACHFMDLPFWALGLRAPVTVSAEGPTPHKEAAPDWTVVKYGFPAESGRPAIRLTWYCGAKRPPHIAEGKIPSWGAGVLFVGEKGMLLSDYSRYVLLPEKEFAGFERPPKTIPDSIGHHEEWLRAIKTGGKASCAFDYAGPLSEAVLLGNVAYRTGAKLQWDAARCRVTNSRAADRLLKPHYRKSFG